MQQYIFNFAQGDVSVPQFPKVYGYFTPDNRMRILSWNTSRPARDVPEKVANALQWLRGLPAPSDNTIGSVSGRRDARLCYLGALRRLWISPA